jgi:hypothetical protein
MLFSLPYSFVFINQMIAKLENDSVFERNHSAHWERITPAPHPVCGCATGATFCGGTKVIMSV